MRGTIIGLLALALPSAALADEVIQLIDKTEIVGKLIHYYDGVLTVQLPSGATMKLPREKLMQIRLKLPKPRPELSTPQKSFERMRQAALKGDLETYIDAHSTYYQMFLNHQVMEATPSKFRRQLQKEWSSMQLQVVGTEKKGETATLKVRRKQGNQTEEGEFRFVRENGEWKMILPL